MQEGFKSLTVWQKSMALVQGVYKLASDLPTHERYALADQIRRSAVSIPSNIAEGSRRGSKKDYAHFVAMAHGSLAELETQILLVTKLYPTLSTDHLVAQVDEVSRMLLVLGRRLRD
jgi:four helix bundle protein